MRRLPLVCVLGLALMVGCEPNPNETRSDGTQQTTQAPVPEVEEAATPLDQVPPLVLPLETPDGEVDVEETMSRIRERASTFGEGTGPSILPRNGPIVIEFEQTELGSNTEPALAELVKILRNGAGTGLGASDSDP